MATTIQGKGVFPEHHPLWLWNGLGETVPSVLRDVMSGCDAMLAIGARFSEVGTGSYGFTPPPTVVHVDINPAVFNRNVPATRRHRGGRARRASPPCCRSSTIAGSGAKAPSRSPTAIGSCTTSGAVSPASRA